MGDGREPVGVRTALHGRPRPTTGARAPRTASRSATTSSPKASPTRRHAKFEHSKGSLIHDNITDILIYGNLYAHNFERSPLFKGGVHGAIVNNFIYNPGARALHYNLQPLEWGDAPFQNGRMTVVGNVLRAGPSTPSDIAFMMLGGGGDLDYHGRDNIAVDRLGRPLPMFGRYTTIGRAHHRARRRRSTGPTGLAALSAVEVENWVLKNAGARPWDRDPHDVRVLADVAEGRGKIIDSETEVGGYPNVRRRGARSTRSCGT